MSAGLTPVLEGALCLQVELHSWRGRCVCRFNSSPWRAAVSAGLTPVLEGALCLQV